VWHSFDLGYFDEGSLRFAAAEDKIHYAACTLGRNKTQGGVGRISIKTRGEGEEFASLEQLPKANSSILPYRS
jgi:hypothetical protein